MDKLLSVINDTLHTQGNSIQLSDLKDAIESLQRNEPSKDEKYKILGSLLMVATGSISSDEIINDLLHIKYFYAQHVEDESIGNTGVILLDKIISSFMTTSILTSKSIEQIRATVLSSHQIISY